jgi:hypothetical protein
MTPGSTPLEYAPWRVTRLGSTLDLGAAARLLERVDPYLGRATRFGAAFVAVKALRPGGGN